MLMPSIFGENLFDDFFDIDRPARRPVKFPVPASDIMKTDIKETDKAFDLDIELPGYNKEDVKAELKDGYMTITASANSTNEEKAEDGKFIRRERYIGACSRSFYVGDNLKKEDISARFDNGILKITVPKKTPEPQIEENHLISIA